MQILDFCLRGATQIPTQKTSTDVYDPMSLIGSTFTIKNSKGQTFIDKASQPQTVTLG